MTSERAMRRKSRIQASKSTNEIVEHAELLGPLLFTDNLPLDSLVPERESTTSPELGPDPSRPRATVNNIMITENEGITNATSEDARVELFYEMEKTVQPQRLEMLLNESWKVDPLQTLKIIFHARSSFHGKGERLTFYRACAFLARQHPATLLRNLPFIVNPVAPNPAKFKRDDSDEDSTEKKCEKDLEKMEISEKSESTEKVFNEKVEATEIAEETFNEKGQEPSEKQVKLTPENARSTGYWKDLLNLLVLAFHPSELRVDASMECLQGVAENNRRSMAALRGRGRGNRREKFAEELKHGRQPIDVMSLDERKELFKSNPFASCLFYTVAHMFASQLRSDLSAMRSALSLVQEGRADEAKELRDTISMAAKWAPSLGKSHDRHTGIATAIALCLYCGDAMKEEEPWKSKDVVIKALDCYRHEFLVPLRKHLSVVEQKMSAREWSEIIYSRVPSIAMKMYKDQFEKRDHDGFMKYLLDVATGKASISGAALTPATLAHDVLSINTGGRRKSDISVITADLQWNSLVKSIREASSDENGVSAFESCIALCDVSGSMTMPVFGDGTVPLHSSIGLSLLISELATGQFNNSILTFSTVPKMFHPKGESFSERACNLWTAPWNGSTDFVAAMRLILSEAQENKVPAEKMIQRVFVFSDMEFNDATSSKIDFRTHHTILEQEFSAAGYTLPEMVYWNLAGGRTGQASKPTTANVPGTALVSGYSAALLKTFIENGGKFDDVCDEEFEMVTKDGDDKKSKMTPIAVMLKAIDHVSFAGLRVYD